LSYLAALCYTESMAQQDTPRRDTMPRTRKVQVTISDEAYEEMLAVRLSAKHGFEAGTVTEEELKAAQKAVRDARKVRKQEGAVVERFRQVSAPMHGARTKKPANAA
jgi:hypothetical protein